MVKMPTLCHHTTLRGCSLEQKLCSLFYSTLTHTNVVEIIKADYPHLRNQFSMIKYSDTEMPPIQVLDTFFEMSRLFQKCKRL